MSELVSLTIDHAPNKTTYFVGDRFERYGMVVKAHYDDGTSNTIDFYMCSPTNPLTIDDTQITVSFMDKSVTQSITVINPPSTGYFINKCLDKANYGNNPYVNTVDGSISFYNSPITIERDSYQLNVVLSYHSRMSDKESDLIKGFYKGFRTNYHQFLVKDGKDNDNNDIYKYIDGNGYIHTFLYNEETNLYHDKEGRYLILNITNRTITDAKDNVYTFDTSGRLISIQSGLNSSDIKIIEYNSDGLRKIYDNRNPNVYIKFSYNFSFLLYIRAYYNDDDNPLKTYTFNGLFGQITSITESVGNNTRTLYEYLYNDREKVRRIVDHLNHTAYRLTYDFDTTLNDYRFNSIRQGYMSNDSLIEQKGIYFVRRNVNTIDPYKPIYELVIEDDNDIKFSFMSDSDGQLVSTFELDEENENNYLSFIKEQGKYAGIDGECADSINSAQAVLYTNVLSSNQGLLSTDLDSSKYVKLTGYLKIKSEVQRATLYVSGSHIYPDTIDVNPKAKNIWQYFEVDIERETNNDAPVAFSSFSVQLIDDNGYYVESEFANLYFVKSQARQRLFFLNNNHPIEFNEIGSFRFYTSLNNYTLISNSDNFFYMNENDLLMTMKDYYKNSPNNDKKAYFLGSKYIKSFYGLLMGESSNVVVSFFDSRYVNNDVLGNVTNWFFATSLDAKTKTYYRFKSEYYEIIVRNEITDNNNQIRYIDDISKYNYLDQLLENRKTYFDDSYNESITITTYEYFVDGQTKKIYQTNGNESIVLYEASQNSQGYLSRIIKNNQGVDVVYDSYLERTLYKDTFYSNGTVARSYYKKEVSYDNYLQDISSVTFKCDYDIIGINSISKNNLITTLSVNSSPLYELSYDETNNTSTFKRYNGSSYDNVVSIKETNLIHETTYFGNSSNTIVTNNYDEHRRLIYQKLNNEVKVSFNYQSNWESTAIANLASISDKYLDSNNGLTTVYQHNFVDKSLSLINFNNGEFIIENDSSNKTVKCSINNDIRKVVYITDENGCVNVDIGTEFVVSHHKLFYRKDAFNRLKRHYSQGPRGVYLLSDINYIDDKSMPSGFFFGNSQNGSSINYIKLSERYEYNGYGDLYKIYVNNSSTPITYASDGFSRIVEESNNPISSFNRHYSYDNYGRLSSFGSNQLSYNSKGQLEYFGNIHFTYDNYGNRLTKGNELYTWTRGKLLNSITKDDRTISFTYDYLGRRYQKLIDGNVVSTYYYLGNKLIGENRSNDLKLRFIYDDTGIVGFYAFDGHGRDYYFHYVKNPFGQIVAITDEEGEIEAQYVYDAWGNHKVLDPLGHETNEGIGVENPIRYKGYYFDSEINLYYLLARYYDPSIGQFISPDDYNNSDINKISGHNLYYFNHCLEVFRISTSKNTTFSVINYDVEHYYKWFDTDWPTFFIFSNNSAEIASWGLSIFEFGVNINDHLQDAISNSIGYIDVFLGYSAEEKKAGVVIGGSAYHITFGNRFFSINLDFLTAKLIVGHKDGKWTFDYGFGWFDFGISINFLEIWKWLTGR